MMGTPEELSQYLWQLDKDTKYEIKEYRERRSLDANAYLWVLIGKIGNKLRKSKEEVYLQMLKDYGQSEIVSILSSINPSGFFKYYEKVGTGVINNKEVTHYKIFKGSSEYNTLEMSILIDGVVQEAEQLDIETLETKRIQEMIKNWEK